MLELLSHPQSNSSLKMAKKRHFWSQSGCVFPLTKALLSLDLVLIKMRPFGVFDHFDGTPGVTCPETLVCERSTHFSAKQNAVI